MMSDNNNLLVRQFWWSSISLRNWFHRQLFIYLHCIDFPISVVCFIIALSSVVFSALVNKACVRNNFTDSKFPLVWFQWLFFPRSRSSFLTSADYFLQFYHLNFNIRNYFFSQCVSQLVNFDFILQKQRSGLWIEHYFTICRFWKRNNYFPMIIKS